VANLCAKFEVSSFDRSRDMEGVSFCVTDSLHSLTHSLTDTQTDFIICPMLLTHLVDKNAKLGK